MLEAGEIDVAIMSTSESFPERFDVTPLFRERFMLAFPAGHRLGQYDAIPIAAIDGEIYLKRVNCEYWDHLSRALRRAAASRRSISYSSEREDWIQNMVAGGLGICFIPEYSAVIPGLQVRPVAEPEVSRDVCLVTVSGRRFSPAVSTFVNAVKSYGWAEAGRSPRVACSDCAHLRCGARPHACVIASGYRNEKHAAFLFTGALAQSPSMPRTHFPAGLDKEKPTMPSKSIANRTAAPHRAGLGLLASAAALSTAPAFAGECPADQVADGAMHVRRNHARRRHRRGALGDRPRRRRATPGRATCCACASWSSSPAASCRGTIA